MNKEILWLPGWYPSKIDAFTGDFIQRHAKALALFAPVHVLFIVRDKNRVVTNSVHVEERINGNLTETIIYYASNNYWFAFADKFMSMKKYKEAYKQYFSKKTLQNKSSVAVHVHVAYKAGLIALWIKRKFGLEYYVSEHWSGYGKTDPDNYFTRSPIFRHLNRKILLQSKCIISVSEDLAKKIYFIAPSSNIKVIPNVVDEKSFYLEKKESGVFRFAHNVSYWKGPKNTEGLLNAFFELQKKRSGWECVMYGPVPIELIEMTNRLGLKERIRFTGEILYENVAEIVRTATVYVSFSNYENQPCSILEALCCGVPVIATRVGGIPEIINSQNGLLISPGNESELVQAMNKMMDNISDFNNNEIAEDARSKFSYETVGKELLSLYRS
jgi:glycosyltransferase involved in cell wall biosynthesis